MRFMNGNAVAVAAARMYVRTLDSHKLYYEIKDHSPLRLDPPPLLGLPLLKDAARRPDTERMHASQTTTDTSPAAQPGTAKSDVSGDSS